MDLEGAMMIRSAAAWICRAATLGILIAGLGACATSGGNQAAPSALPTQQGVSANLDYRLGAGDKLRVIVFGEQDLSGEFDVTGTGKASLPLIGQVQATGLTLDEFEQEIAGKLKEGYLTNPKISVEVLNYRPFYIMGEVDKPGEYPYTSAMTVLNAVAVAGGFTYRASQDHVFITRGGREEDEYPANQSVRVLPGDIVRIPERFF
ncbi:MAG TPA: polysaccharide biosynthesis/export family protein [Parvibaculum sp.]|jgi:polysaccharide export outer membrane protein